MVYIRRRPLRIARRPLRARRTIRKLRRVTRVPRMLSIIPTRQKATLFVKRKVFCSSINPSTVTTANFFSYVTPSLSSAGSMANVNIGGLTNIGEYQALFDQFKLSAIKYELYPRVTDLVNDQNPATGGTFRDRPYVSFCIDKKGTLTPTGTYVQATWNQFAESGNVKTVRGDKKVTIYLNKPMINEQFGGGANRYVSPKYADLDGAGTTMQHRGFYIFFHTQTFAGSALIGYDVYATYYLAFKGQK